MGTLSTPLLTGSSFVLLLPTIASIISNTLADPSLDTKTVDHELIWKRFVEPAQKRAEPLCHEAAAMIVAATSSRFDCLAELKSTLRTLKVGTSFIGQQSVTRLLGAFDYGSRSACRELVDIVIDRLIKLLDPKVCLPRSRSRNRTAEIVSNCPTERADLQEHRGEEEHPGLPRPHRCRVFARCESWYVNLDQNMLWQRRSLTAHASLDLPSIVRTMQKGMEDYTTDERGDVSTHASQAASPVPILTHFRRPGKVGSWVRTTCMRRLTDVVLSVPSLATLDDCRGAVVGLLLKQSAERIDNVREVAGQQLKRLQAVAPVLDEWVAHVCS